MLITSFTVFLQKFIWFSQRDPYILIYDVIEYHMMSCDFVQDILYCYPTEARDWSTASGEGVRSEEVRSEEVTALLMKLRGVFLTLSDVMGSITADSHSWSVNIIIFHGFILSHNYIYTL